MFEDQGIGVAPEKLPHLFERFYRAVSERSYGGLGLGLFIVRQIVEAHGGRVWVESTLGEGSRFFADIHNAKPARSEETEASPPSVTEAHP